MITPEGLLRAAGLGANVQWTIGLAFHLCRTAGAVPIDSRHLLSRMDLADERWLQQPPFDAMTVDFRDGRVYVVYHMHQRYPGRTIWSIVHELGHLLLQHPSGRMYPQTGKYIPPPAWCEAEADAFAGEVLLPETELLDFRRRRVGAYAIARQKGVSLTAVRIRLRHLDREAHAG